MKSVIIIGGGYSVKEGINLGLWTKIQGKEIWSLNYAYKTMPYLPTRELWVDKSFFKSNVESLQSLWSQGVLLQAKRHFAQASLEREIRQYETSREREKYFGKNALNKGVIYYGRMGLCGMFALSLAIAEGYTNIFCLGYDFGTPSVTDSKTHYYIGDIETSSTGIGRPSIYLTKDNTVKEEVADFEVYIRETYINIWNVSLRSNIPYFHQIYWDEFFRKIE